MSHKGISSGDNSSVIAALENGKGYPPIMRLGKNNLKMSKSDFREKLEEAIEKKLITIDFVA